MGEVAEVIEEALVEVCGNADETARDDGGAGHVENGAQ